MFEPPQHHASMEDHYVKLSEKLPKNALNSPGHLKQNLYWNLYKM